jgi:hypothetical protein
MEVIAQRRPLLVGAVSAIPRLRLGLPVKTIIPARDEIRAAMEANGYLSSAPFKTVSVIFRYADSENLEPDRYEIDPKTECLNLAIEFDGRVLAQLSEQEQAAKFRMALIDVLCDVAANFELPYEFLDELRHET